MLILIEEMPSGAQMAAFDGNELPVRPESEEAL
jgi:hypothetical protein